MQILYTEVHNMVIAQVMVCNSQHGENYYEK